MMLPSSQCETDANAERGTSECVICLAVRPVMKPTFWWRHAGGMMATDLETVMSCAVTAILD